jgi:hypothetical protein
MYLQIGISTQLPTGYNSMYLQIGLSSTQLTGYNSAYLQIGMSSTQLPTGYIWLYSPSCCQRQPDRPGLHSTSVTACRAPVGSNSTWVPSGRQQRPTTQGWRRNGILPEQQHPAPPLASNVPGPQPDRESVGLAAGIHNNVSICSYLFFSQLQKGVKVVVGVGGLMGRGL